MGDAYWIVERLGEPPFNRKLDLLSFRCVTVLLRALLSPRREPSSRGAHGALRA